MAGSSDYVARELYRRELFRSDYTHGYHCDCEDCTYGFGHSGNLFKVQMDSSCGGEVISSPLTWNPQDGADPAGLFSDLEDILVPVPIDQRCGLHVHGWAQDLSDRQLGRLYELVHHHEAVLFRLATGRAREHRGYRDDFNYCRPLSAFTNRLEVEELALAKSADVKRSPIANQKYIMANLMPLDRLGTVEFRHWETTKVAWRMELFTKLSVALIQRAKHSRHPLGEPFHLGQVPEESVISQFMDDLDSPGNDVVDQRLHELVMDQWNHSTWQPSIRFRPLPHFRRTATGRNVAMSEDDEGPVVMQYDSHGHTVRLPGQEGEEPDYYADYDPEPPTRAERIALEEAIREAEEHEHVNRYHIGGGI